MDYPNFAYHYNATPNFYPSATLTAPAYLTGGPPPLSGSVQLVTLGSPNNNNATRNNQGGLTAITDSDGSELDPELENLEDEEKKNPFAPECSVPLPFQIGDEYGYYGPSAIWKRNERERHRVRCVNEGYERLRTHLPDIHFECTSSRDRRLSKVDTLRLAIRYIAHLQNLLVDEHHERACKCYVGFTLTTEHRPLRKRKSTTNTKSTKEAVTTKKKSKVNL